VNLQQLKILRAIAKTGSFHSAAQSLHLTQPAISHQLKSLEDELGESLVLRSRPKVSLLPAGLVVLAAAERIAAEMENLKLHFSPREADEVTGVLRVAASTLGIVYLYGDLLQAFIERYPRIELVVTATESGVDGARQLLAGLADVAFAPFPIQLPNLEFTLLAETEHVVIVSRTHALGRQSEVTADQLRAYPFIRYQPDAGSRSTSDQIFLSSGDYPPIFLESNDTEFIQRVVAMGMGAAIVPSFTVRTPEKRRQLAVLRVQGVAVRQGFGLVCRVDTRMRALRLFQELCMEQREVIAH
jgi:DNA-binding transcriptional LysR family regulator